ncbi:MAG: radical SAM protein [Armatimonadetes bacterium]|nr:radical SAM protein [Armatimonadota bacterium]
MSAKAPVKYKYLYGPVPSRRLGRSLGVDIVPHKVCSYDCIYCQLGRTTELTSIPGRLVGAKDVMWDIEQWLEHGGTADYITFAGSGEPTLNTDLGEMIRAIKRLTDIPLAVITNGSLLYNVEIRDAVSMADVLLPSLDAGTQHTFRAVNRPAPGISFAEMTEGLVQTAQESHGQIWLEIMLVEGVNDSDAELHAMCEIIQLICPDKVQLNTVERPSKSGEAKCVSDETLRRACKIFGGTAEIIAGGVLMPADKRQWREVRDELMRMLSRRPCTIDDIVTASGRNIHEVTKHLQRLMQEGLIEQIGDTDPYYRCVTGG